MSPKQIVKLRTDLGLTQQELADKLGAQQATVARWETGKNQPRGANLKALEELAAKWLKESKTMSDQLRTTWPSSISRWDSLRAIQNYVDIVKPLQDQIRQFEQIQKRLGNSRAITGIQDAVRQFEKTRNIFRDFEKTRNILRDFENTRRDILGPFESNYLGTSGMLAAALRPLTDFRNLVLPYDVRRSFDRIGSAFQEARFLAELKIPSQEDAQNASQVEPDLAEQVETRLVEIVPAESLDSLRRVEFAPLLLLDRALRDPDLIRQLSGRDFEGFVATLVEQLGFENVVLTPRSGDEGRDVIATKHIHGIAILFAFECKRYAPDRRIGPDILRALLGTITAGRTRAAKGILVTTSSFTPAAHNFIITEPTLDGRDFDGIVEWVREYGSKTRSPQRYQT